MQYELVILGHSYSGSLQDIVRSTLLRDRELFESREFLRKEGMWYVLQDGGRYQLPEPPKLSIELLPRGFREITSSPPPIQKISHNASVRFQPARQHKKGSPVFVPPPPDSARMQQPQPAA